MIRQRNCTRIYNPAKPDEYFYPELLRARFVVADKRIMSFAVILMLPAIFYAIERFLISHEGKRSWPLVAAIRMQEISLRG